MRGRDDTNGGGISVFFISNNLGFSPTVTLIGLTLTGGDSGGDGGAILVSSAYSTTVSIIDSTFVGNHTLGAGGAIAATIFTDSTLSIVRSTFADNHAAGRGGSIFADVFSPTGGGARTAALALAA